jgi:hypothetical protein
MEKKLSARQFAVIPYARCTKGLGGVNNILNQEVRLYVFLLGQGKHLCASGPDRRRSLAFSIMVKLMYSQYFSGESSARMDPSNDER